MQMSVFAYISLGMAACATILAYIVSPDATLALTLLPMLLLLGGIPLLMNRMNRRHVAKLDLRHVKLEKIRECAKRGIGEQVRIRGTVTDISNRWMNQPNFRVVDSSGEINIYMFVPPGERFQCGDQIEVVGTLRWAFGFRKKEKKIWGLQMKKLAAAQRLAKHA